MGIWKNLGGWGVPILMGGWAEKGGVGVANRKQNVNKM